MRTPVAIKFAMWPLIDNVRPSLPYHIQLGGPSNLFSGASHHTPYDAQSLYVKHLFLICFWWLKLAANRCL